MDDPCRRAFTSLAYTRFQRVPLYLEWAPTATFAEPAPLPAATAAPAPAAKVAPAPASTDAGAVGSKRKRPVAAPAESTAAAAGGDGNASSSTAAPGDASSAQAAAGFTLYVKNVSFTTTEEGLRDMFASVGALRSVRIPRRRNPKARSATGDKPRDASVPEYLSMGYGFVEFASAADAGTALRTLQGAELDGHALELRLAEGAAAGGGDGGGAGPAAAAPQSKKPRRSAGDATATGGAASGGGGDANGDERGTKLLVRNLAFEATKGDLQGLFTPFGAVKSIRLPKKFNGSTRGFAFVEFLTHAEAVAAKRALADTHLYGRHLVTEWAATDAAGDAGAGVGAGGGGAGGGAEN